MSNLSLKVSKSAYEEKIAKMQSLMNKLDQAIEDYQTLKNDMDKFIDGSDDNYERLRANIDENIKTVRIERERMQNSVEMLQVTLKEMEDFGQGLGTALEESIELAKSAVKTGIEIMKIVD